MFVLVIAIFGICWLPYHVYFIYSFHDQSIVRYDEHNSAACWLPYHVYFIYSFHDQSIVRYDEHNSAGCPTMSTSSTHFMIRALTGTMNIIVRQLSNICWLPYHVYFIYSFHDQSIVRCDEQNSPAII
jgi:hypothetical protein